MKLIGIAGTNGSGKDTVGALLAEKHNWLFVSVSDLLREECRRRNLDVTRENLRLISAEWRREGGYGVLIDKAVNVYNDAGSKYRGLAVSSLRHPGECERVTELEGVNVWVDADTKIRYERISKANRGRGAEDNISYEEFLEHEKAEMHQTGDGATLNMAAVKILADEEIMNESDLTALDEQLMSLLEKYHYIEA